MIDPPALPYALAPLSLAPAALVLGYAAVILLARRTQWFDLTFHVLVLLLIGVALGAGGPARALATAVLVTILAASLLALVFGTGTRSPGERDRRPFANRTATLRRPLGPPKPSVAR
ncbi:MAG: hypothetical protein JNM30_01275 [Rhodospirillales bacterium]|nr:hypothetical protein [Rhodospirillales bacterium]